MTKMLKGEHNVIIVVQKLSGAAEERHSPTQLAGALRVLVAVAIPSPPITGTVELYRQ